jgi:BirA family transcriptional regulator, biotin operon repressor / biotin---[acetyl-CoA-carboxylase] ligase
MQTKINIGESTLKWAKSNHIPCWFEQEATSTNDLAKSGGFKNEKHWIYLANQQTQGRGRKTNTWSNSTHPGDQLIISWCFKLEKNAQPISSPIFGWAVHKSLNDEFDINLSIKAPNDIYAKDKKLAGILLESVSQGTNHYICVGLGLNVNSAPTTLATSTYLANEISAELNEQRWYRFMSSLENNLLEAASMCQFKEIPSLYQSELLTALKKWPQNQVSQMNTNGDLILSDGQKISWADL